jgi:Retroviral aspartyl protease
MIRGYFSPVAEGHRPLVDALVEFPTAGGGELGAQFLVDTGADRSVLGSLEALRLGTELEVDLATLPQGPDIGGVGGSVFTQQIEVVLVMGDERIACSVLVTPPYPAPAMLCLLGRDILSRFALFLEEQSGRVLLLTHAEASLLRFP